MYYADLGHGIGSEQEGYRPVVIIQNDVGNKHSPTVIIASITSKKDAKPKLPTHYYIGIEAGLELPSIVLLEQLRTVDKRRLSEFIGHLPEKHIQGINHALAISIGLIDSVPKKLILAFATPVPTIFMVQVLLLCGGSTRHKPKKTPALIATAERVLIMRSFQRPDRRGNEITGSIPTCVLRLSRYCKCRADVRNVGRYQSKDCIPPFEKWDNQKFCGWPPLSHTENLHF